MWQIETRVWWFFLEILMQNRTNGMLMTTQILKDQKNLSRLLLLFTKPFLFTKRLKVKFLSLIIFLIRLVIEGGSLSSDVTVSWGMKLRIILRTVLLNSINCLFTSTLWNAFSQSELAIERWIQSEFCLVCSVTPLFHSEVDK